MSEESGNLDSLGVTAVVLTHRRPHLAGNVVRGLLENEGFPPERVVVVVNGSGGLDDPELEASVQMVWLAENFGPAAGFGAGMLHAFADPDTKWAYLCEDDIGLFGLPFPRVASLVQRLEADAALAETGAVVAYGRRFVGRGHSENVVPGDDERALVPVDVAAWGATLLSRQVVERGVLPDTEWYFGYEDFDFFCRVRAAGLQVLVDPTTARVAAHVQTTEGRDGAMAGVPPERRRRTLARLLRRPQFHAPGPSPRVAVVDGVALRVLSPSHSAGVEQRRAARHRPWSGRRDAGPPGSTSSLPAPDGRIRRD